jgi:hypothetical protein
VKEKPKRRPDQRATADDLGPRQPAHPANARPRDELLTQLQREVGNSLVQRLVGEAQSGQQEIVAGRANQSLDPATRERMETAYAEDLGDVKLHADAAAADLADEHAARALTRGSDVYFAPGALEPADPAGRELLAPELAPVVQQRGSADRQASSAAPDLEQEADRAAGLAASGSRARVDRRSAPPLQRQPAEQQPRIAQHGAQIGPTPPQGTITVAGQFTVAYHFNVVAGADFVALTLAVPAGVSVGVVPLTEMRGDDHVLDPGGSGARAVTISVPYHLRRLPLIQVSFTRGSFVYLVVFQFPSTTPSQPSQPSQPGQPTGP